MPIINLHPEIAIPRGELSNPTFSANMHLTQLAWDRLGEDIDGIADGDMLILSWDQLKILWDLYKNGKVEILAKKMKVSPENTQESFFQVLTNFTSQLHMESCSTPANIDFAKLIEGILETDERELRRFCIYYRENLFFKNLEFYRTAFDTIFGAWQDLKQVRLLNRLNVEGSKYVISSIHFDNTKKTYGDLFEILDKTYNFLPLLVRLRTEHQFDRFTNTDLDGYLKSSLQNKIQHITSTEVVPIPDDKITNNKIRNSSHHNTIGIDLKTQMVNCEDRGSNVSLPYVDYLSRCTNLANYIAGQFILELDFIEFAQKA